MKQIFHHAFVHDLRTNIMTSMSPYLTDESQYSSLSRAFNANVDIEDYEEESEGFLDDCNRYFKEIVIPHKKHVFEAGLMIMESDIFKAYCKSEPFVRRLAIHDMSKFSYIEAAGYMYKHFKGMDFNAIEFKMAWHHHKQMNDHHPENWISVNSRGDVEFLPMGTYAIFEMIADLIGAGKSYGESFEDWYPKNCHKTRFHKSTAEFIVRIISALYPQFKQSLTLSSDDSPSIHFFPHDAK